MLTSVATAPSKIEPNYKSLQRTFLGPFFYSLSMTILSVSVCIAAPTLSSKMQYQTSESKFAEAQCKAWCFKSYADSLQSEKNLRDTLRVDISKKLRRRPDLLENFCRKSPSCNRCANMGCNLDHQVPDCDKHCEGEVFCLRGCREILRLTTTHKLDKCPVSTAPQIRGLTRATCSKTCEENADCGTHEQCCPAQSACGGQSCVAVGTTTSVDLPLMPQLTLTPRTNSSYDIAFAIDPSADYTRPIVFLIQMRYVISDKFEAEYASKWHDLTTTTHKSVELQGMEVGYFYQVKAAAVSHLGSRGYGKASTPVKLPRDPQPPSIPRNVTDGVWRIYATGTVDVNIHWKKPKYSYLQIYAYEISWVRDHGYVQSDGKSVVSFTKFSKLVFPSSLTYVIQNLQPSTAYKIEVRAKSKWGNQMLVSRPNTIYITTPKIGDTRTKEAKATFSSTECRCHDPLRNEGAEFTILKPMFDGSLVTTIKKAGVTDDADNFFQVEWSPRVCIDSQSQPSVVNHPNNPPYKITTQTSTFTLRNLQFNCRYDVKITPLNLAESNSKTFSSCFCTPSCHELMMQEGGSQRRKVCQQPTEPEIIPPPASLRIIRKDNMGDVFIVYWESQKHLNHIITHYRFVWGPRLDEPVNQESYSLNGLQAPLDVSRAETRVLDNNVTSFTLQNLKRATLYIVKVQALSLLNGRKSESLETRTIFTTPGFPHYPIKLASISGEVSKYVKQLDSNCATFIKLTMWSSTKLLALCLLTQLMLPT